MHKGILYTIGHSKHEYSFFESMLKKYDISYLLDVRSVPFSRFAETYNRNNIKSLLAESGITYKQMGKYFGARPQDEALYTSEHFLDFEKVRGSKLFLEGVENVILGLDKGNNVALMCTEKDPLDCHRAIMVSKGFLDAGINVNHILENGLLQTQLELEQRMLKKYYPDRDQLTLFNYETGIDESECIRNCYIKRNQEIGYHISEEE